MYNQFVMYPTVFPFFGHPAFVLLFVILVVWELAWKGYAAWKAARDNQPYWFVAVLILNTVGVLPIIYLYFFSDKRKK